MIVDFQGVRGLLCLMVVFVSSLCNVVLIVLCPFLLVLFFPMVSLLLSLVVCVFIRVSVGSCICWSLVCLFSVVVVFSILPTVLVVF